jgi:uncharacterized damage-inducible protein DinB
LHDLKDKANIPNMRVEKGMVRRTLETARQTFLDNVRSVSIDEALDAAGGYRSTVGLIKHTAGWTEVYRSYAFDDEPTSWTEIDWPFGLRERIELSPDYLDAIRAWYEEASARWLAESESPLDLDAQRPVHWGGTWPLGDIIASVADHWSYHAGEINALLAIPRGEAWEYGEHVEENHIATIGHSVRRDWVSDEDVARHEAEMRRAQDPDRP